MTYQLSPLPHTERIRRCLPRPRSVVLLLLLATIVMPVTHRAGSDHAHAHTIFQGVIDLVVGHPHHHGNHADETQGNSVSPFAPVDIPLPVVTGPEVDSGRSGMVSPEPDAPELLGMSMPIASFASIHALGLLVAALLAGSAPRALFQHLQRPLTRSVRVEVPPPRTT